MKSEVQETNTNNKKRNDKFLIGGILVITIIASLLVWMVVFQKGTKAVVMVDGTVILEQALSEDCQIPIETEQGYNLFKIEDGKAFIEEADCRDQICVEHIGISKAGETIVCLPHKLVVEIQ